MNLKTIMQSKKGAAILEAVLILPAFIAAMALLLQIFPLLAAWEDACFITCQELKLENIRAHFVKNPALLPLKTDIRLQKSKGPMRTCLVTGYDYLYDTDLMDDLLCVQISGSFRAANPMGGTSGTGLCTRIGSRAFTGSIRKAEPGPDDFTRDQAADPVYIFPKWGKRYHKLSCSFLHPCCRKTYLNARILKDFRPCHLCRADEMQVGDPVFCFFTDGSVYHRGGCSQVDKYYEEIEREDAQRQGYEACATCGG